MTACGDVCSGYKSAAGCLPEDAPMQVGIQDPGVSLAASGMFMTGVEGLRQRENHQRSFAGDLVAAAAANPSALHN